MPAGSALLVVDMQNDFCLPGAVLEVAGAMSCLPKVQEAVDAARRAGVHIIWVIRLHDKDGAPDLVSTRIKTTTY
jgi:nicotinamidase-related amidase